MKVKTFKALGLMISILMVIPTVVTAQPMPAADTNIDRADLQLEAVEQVTAVQATGRVLGEVKGATGPAIYIVQLAAAPLASYRGGLEGLQATNPAARGEARLDVSSLASQTYLGYLEAQQSQFLGAARAALGRDISVRFAYQYTFNGLAVELTPDEAAQVAALKGVVMVQRDYLQFPQTDVGPEWIGAPAIWEGTATGGLDGTQGEGVIVGIIDTGINMDHPSFAEVGPFDGYEHENPLGEDVFVGLCATEPMTYTCSSKLIGAWDYVDGVGMDDPADGPEDSNGHGSHTASTTAGNWVTATITAPTIVVERLIKGVAPHANIIAYDVCYGDPGGCPQSASMAAANQAVADGVDVINFSIGGGPANPWEDAGSLNWLGVRDAGVFVATSAGNDGPDPATMGSPGNSPWMLTVGATTHNRDFVNSLINMEGGTAPEDMVGTGITSGYGPDQIVHAKDFDEFDPGDPDDGQCLEPFPAGTWTNGEIVACDRGTIARVDKGANVLAGGAAGFVLLNTAADGESISADAHYLPAVHLGYANSQILRAWLDGGETYTATISGVTLDVDPAYADIMASFSSRGPNPDSTLAEDIIRPDVAAPGISVIAAYRNGIEFASLGGTSMASPHAAGSAALLRALYPDWTAAEVQSALMMSAWTDVLKEDKTTPADPFDMGAGRIDLTKAAEVGFVLDETTDGFENADPALAGDPADLNMPSLGEGSCLAECSWVRELSSTQTEPVTWTVSVMAAEGMTVTVTPSVFELEPGGTLPVTVTADVQGLPYGAWLFGTVIFTPDDAELPSLHMPLAVRPSSGVLPSIVEIDTRRDAGSYLIEGVETTEALELTLVPFGLTAGTMTDFDLAQIPDNTLDFPDIFFQDLDSVFVMELPVPAGSPRLVVDILESESPDLDMVVIYDNDDDGVPELSDTVHPYCQSAAGGPFEYCDIAEPDEGTWFVMVLNFTASGEGAVDTSTVATAVVSPDDLGNMTFEAPTSVPTLVPFDIRLFWDIPEMVAGDRYYGAFSIGTSPENPGDIGLIPVDLVRHADDVVKTASASGVMPGDVVTFTITVMPNVTKWDMTYNLTDTIPAGLTYVPGSASATSGELTVMTDTIYWTGEVVSPFSVEPVYLVSTSAEDPNCAVPLANSGAYLNLQAFNIFAQAAITGDTLWFSAFSTGDPLQYWGQAHTGINFTDDGMAFFSSTPGATQWVNRDIPDPAEPNNLLAFFWSDWEVVYEAPPANRGVSLASLGGTGAGGGVVIEYDDVQPFEDPTQTVDYEVFVWRTPDTSLGSHDIIFAYDNINLDEPITVGTIGIENALGTEGVKYAYDDVALQTLQDGMAICFDWFVEPTDPVIITFAATVDAGVVGQVTNNVLHNTDNPGSMEASASVVIWVGNRVFLPVVLLNAQ